MCVAVLYGAWMYEGINRMSVKPTDAVELFENHNDVIPFHLDEPDPPVRRRRERERKRERERERERERKRGGRGRDQKNLFTFWG